jgi:predicted transport protein
MKAIDRPFTNIINGTSQFIVPVFQRDYTWEADPQCAQLWRDVIRAARPGGEGGHFLGSIVYIATGDNLAGFTRWLLIDGQQRLTTLTLLLVAMRDHILSVKWVGGEDDPTPKRIDAYFLRNVQEEGDREQKLVLRRHDQLTLRALLEGTQPPKDHSERIVENYNYFREQMLTADPSEVYRGVGRLVIVDVALDRQTDDPQLIFESLNSTGIDLSQSDLIRNFILMRLTEKEQTKLYETYWSRIEGLFRGSEWTFDAFARDYVALKTHSAKQEKAGDIYYAFREFFPQFKALVGGLEETLEDMLRYASYYASFTLGRGIGGERARALARLNRLVDAPAILVMRLLECRDNVGAIEEPQLLEAISQIESYVLRRAISGFQTRGYWQIFASLAYRIGDNDPLTDLKVALACQRENYRYPSDEEFLRALKEGDLYGLRVCKYLLEELENRRSNEPTDTSGYSIEHVMPQNERLIADWRKMLGDDWKEIQKTWLHRLGNLTLTGYNSKYSDRSFDVKKTIEGGFSESSVRLNKFIREQNAWTAKEMQARTNALAQRALSIWGGLSVSQSLISAARRLEKQELAFRRDIGSVKMSNEAKALFERLRGQVLALDSDVLELAEAKSVSYHSPEFFLEVIPRRYSLTLLLPLDFGEVEDASGLAEDATQWKFFVNARYQGGVAMNLSSDEAIELSMPLIRQAHAVSRE